MRQFTLEDIRALNPCHDPGVYFASNEWRGTALDILNFHRASAGHRLWVVLRAGWIEQKALLLFADWCEREAPSSEKSVFASAQSTAMYVLGAKAREAARDAACFQKDLDAFWLARAQTKHAALLFGQDVRPIINAANVTVNERAVTQLKVLLEQEGEA